VRLAKLPEPRIAVLLGGSSGPYVFDSESAGRLAQEASGLAIELGGSLLITTSARTPRDVGDALAKKITVPHFMHHYDPDTTDNPFLGLLGLADHIIVTADSISMISEAVATGKPVLLFDLETGKRAMRTVPTTDGRMPKIYGLGKNISSTVFRWTMRLAPPRWTRDLRIVHHMTNDAGLTRWLGEPAPQHCQPLDHDLQAVVDRIKGLGHKAKS
jgi:uncharacterized protein